jgi:hypothetical protein
MLRWYPARWRARYGDEFTAMVEDDLEGRAPTTSYRWAIARSGLTERLRDSGLIGNSVSPAERVRGGALSVLCAFALFVLPGIAFAKISEHWDESIHRGPPRHLPAVFFNLLGSLAVVCAVAIVLVALALLPAFLEFVRTGGWPQIRRRVLWAASVTMATVVTGVGLVVWAHHLTAHQRNAGFGWYQLAFVIVATLFAVAVFTWTAAAVGATHALTIRLAKVKVLGILAVAVAICMPIMTAAAAAWWGSMATTAPWFLAGTPSGSSPSPLIGNLLFVLITMVIASGVGILGVQRVLRSWHGLRSA